MHDPHVRILCSAVGPVVQVVCSCGFVDDLGLQPDSWVRGEELALAHMVRDAMDVELVRLNR